MPFLRTISLFFILLFHLAVSAQNGDILRLPEPSWVQQANPDLNAALSGDDSMGIYYLLADSQEHLGTDQSYRRYTYKILNSVGTQEMSDISIDFDPAYHTVHIHSINIIRDGVILDKFDEDRIQVVQRETNMERKLYDGRLTIIANLSDTRVGDIIDYSYTITGSNPVYRGKYQAYFKMQFNVDVHQNRVIITVPREEKIALKQLYGANDPEVEQHPDFTRYTWEDFDLQKKLYETNTPVWYDETPAIDISQFNSWAEVNNLFVDSFKLEEKERRLLAEEIENLLPDSKDETTFIETSIRFVQDEVRYLGFEGGINSHIPTHPAKVLERRFGDCKDKSFLLSEILQSRGIKAYPMLVHSYNGPNLSNGLPSPNAFDHCVVQIDLGKKGFKYIDPTISGQGGDLDNIYFPDYKAGLVLKPGTQDLTHLPDSKTWKTSITEIFELDDPGGGANFSVETTYRGDAADSRRRGFMETSLKTIQQEYTSFYSSIYPHIRADGEMIIEDDRDNNEFVVYEKYRIDSIWTRLESNRDIIHAQFYPLSMEDFLYPEKSVEREMPYFLNPDLDVTHKTIVYVPEAWNVQNAKKKVASNYFNWDMDVRYRNATLEITHQYKTLKDHVAAADLKKFMADHAKLQEDLTYSLSYNYEVVGAAKANSTSWAAVGLMILLMTGGGILCFLIYKKYDLPVKTDTRHERKIGGWLILIGIGLVFTPLVVTGQLLGGNYFSSSVWISFFASPETVSMAILLAAELIFYSVLLVFSLLVLVLFFKRRSIAPRMMIILYGGSLAISAIIAFASLGLHPEAFGGPERQDIYLELSKMGLRCAIFIPYLIYSTRVEETFTRTLKKDTEPQEKDFVEEAPVAMIR